MNLRTRWTVFQEQNPRTRIRDAADQLSVTELELVATGCGAEAVRLQGPFAPLVERLPAVGPVMALTRNEHAVHEKTGPYKGVKIMRHVGLVLGEQIDLRLFMQRWVHGFAVTVQTRKGPRESLQFFDEYGQAVHKIYAEADTDVAAWAKLVADFTAEDQSPTQATPEPLPEAPQPNPDVDTEAFLADWAKLTDTHQFFGMLQRHKVTRQQALHLAEGHFARRVRADSAATLLLAAAEGEVPIMVFVGNRGCIQIHTGPVKRILPMNDWINVMDPDFNLHLRESCVDEAWVVEKPTEDGTVTSLELLDATGEIVVRFFGERKPGKPELESWRGLAAALA